MVIFSFKEDRDKTAKVLNTGFFLPGDKNLCFLIHGLTGTAKEMGAIAQRLNKQGFSVVVPLMLNHDKSISCLKRTAWQDIYRSIRDEFVKYADNYDNIFVAGLSFGALIGILLANEFPGRIKALNCFSPTLFYDGWGNPRSRVFLPLVYKTPFKYWLYFKEEYPYGLKNERLRSKVESFYKEASLFDYSKVHLYGYPVIPIACIYQNSLLAKKVISILKNINTPLQLLQAREDDVTSPKNSYYIYNRVSSREKEIVFLEDSYHIITADQERDKVADKTVAFFEKHKS
ncbi:MAG: alpha/beta hydrolase [Candidatus Omnitrophica bacterium]|nr:alpha/beta hydrolase [Candidatus Omnitrophota bacterium]